MLSDRPVCPRDVLIKLFIRDTPASLPASLNPFGGVWATCMGRRCKSNGSPAVTTYSLDFQKTWLARGGASRTGSPIGETVGNIFLAILLSESEPMFARPPLLPRPSQVPVCNADLHARVLTELSSPKTD